MADKWTNHPLWMQLTPCNANARSKRRTVEEEEDKVKREGIYMIEELVEEILIRLPVKSLLRLKATCKSWCFLIKSPSFIDLHKRRHCLDYHDRLLLSRQTPADDGLVMYSCAIPAHNPVVTTTPLFDLGWFPRVSEFAKWPHLIDNPPHDQNDEFFRCFAPYTALLGPLNNGIYLHVHRDSQRRHHVSVGTSKFALCNIATREYKFLNPFPSNTAALLSNLVPNPCQAAYGFGSVHNKAGFVVDYKVVVIVLYGRSYSHMLSFVYSLRRGSWDKIADVRRGMEYSRTNKAAAVAGFVNRQGRVDTPRCPFNIGSIIQQEAFLNGSWHWLDVPLLGIRSRTYDRVLLFDVANEVFQYFAGPPHEYMSLAASSSPHEIRRCLFVLSHHLAVIYLHHDHVGGQTRSCCVGFDVWMMMDYGIGDSWAKIYSAEPVFNNVYADLAGIRYSTSTINSGTSSSSSSIHIQRIFLYDGNSGQLVSWDGSQITEHGFYMDLSKEAVWNAIGISTYVETLESLTLAH